MYSHISVLAQESVNALNIKSDGIYVDSTFGLGGHSKLILKYLNINGKLIVFDKDPEAVYVANKLADLDSRVIVIHSSFVNLKHELTKLNINFIDGILFDLGVSSLQLENPNRGFGFKNNSILDMRMDNTHGITAKQWINETSEQDIAEIIYKYGDEKLSRKISKQIILSRQNKEIETTFELANLVSSVKRKNNKIHPATKTFQAIRIFINNELQEIELALPQALDVLKINGRLVVISFHSLEDRIVKNFININANINNKIPKWVAIQEKNLPTPRLLKIGKFIKPQKNEVLENRRSRSAILRVAQKI